MTTIDQVGQSAFDPFYSVQATLGIAISPALQIIFAPVRNPDEDGVVAMGIRTRLAY